MINATNQYQSHANHEAEEVVSWLIPKRALLQRATVPRHEVHVEQEVYPEASEKQERC